MQVYEHMNISYATMLNLWLQHLYVMIMPSSLFLSFMRYCDMLAMGLRFGLGKLKRHKSISLGIYLLS